jgi:hypothetical protein
MGGLGSAAGVALVTSWWLAGLWEFSPAWSAAPVAQSSVPAPTVVQLSPAAPSECHCHCNFTADEPEAPAQAATWGAYALALVSAEVAGAIVLGTASLVRRVAGSTCQSAVPFAASVGEHGAWEHDGLGAERVGKRPQRSPLGHLAIDAREL